MHLPHLRVVTLQHRVLYMRNEFDLMPANASSGLRQLLFRDELLTSPGQVIRWWERRRLVFNAAVGATGVVTIGVIAALSAIGPHTGGMDGPPPIFILIYGVAANILYTGGWIAELLLRPIFGLSSGTVGATLFRYGFFFAAALTALPIPIAVVSLVGRIAEWLLR